MGFYVLYDYRLPIVMFGCVRDHAPKRGICRSGSEENLISLEEAGSFLALSFLSPEKVPGESEASAWARAVGGARKFRRRGA